MNKLFKYIFTLTMLAVVSVPSLAFANSSVNGPLIFTSITTSPYPVTVGKTIITVNGAGFDHINSVFLSPQNLAPSAMLQIWDYSKTDSKLSFLLPIATKPGDYTVQVYTDDNSSRVILDNNIPWQFTALADGLTSSTITKLDVDSAMIGSTVTITGKNFASTNDVNLRSSTYGATTVTNAQVTNVSSTTIKFVVPTFLTAGNYNVSVINSNGESATVPLTVKTTTVTPSTVDTGVQHSIGTNVLGTDGTVYRIVEGNYRSPYTSAGAFTSYKFNTWVTTVTANAKDMKLPLSTYTPNGASTTATYFIPPRNGALINDKGTVYIITGGLRAGFASESAFKGLGYSYSNVYPGDTSFMVSMDPIKSASQKHPNGTLINDKGTIYVMQNGYRVGFPNMDILESWGYWVTDAVPANAYDTAAEVSGSMTTRLSNQMSI